MAIQLWRSRCGVVINGTNYDFTDYDGCHVQENEAKHLTRGANSTNKSGYVYKENSKQAPTVTFDTVALPREMIALLNKAYDDETRIGLYCVDSVTGESYQASQAILTSKLRQPDVVEGEETYAMPLVFEAYDLKHSDD